jgi:cation diffusion facilitator CzcD-associated flavoprotein CzcO
MAGTNRVASYDTIVIGGGQAGLAAGYHLARQDVDFVILDAGPRIGDSWRRRYAERFDLPVLRDTQVTSLVREDNHFVLRTNGATYEANNVVVAPGPGFTRDFSWIRLPVLDADGTPKHAHGVSVLDGLYFVGDDPAFIAEHIAGRALD